MKKLLLAAFLLTAGMIASQSVGAQTLETIPKEWRLLTKVPPAVVASEDAYYAEITALLIEQDAPYLLGPITYYAYKGDYYATFPVFQAGELILYDVKKYNRKGDELY